MMNALNAQPTNLLVILLGAGKLPKHPQSLQALCKVFTQSHRRMLEYLTKAVLKPQSRDGEKNMEPNGLKNLFDSDKPADEICNEIAEWILEQKKKNTAIDSVLIYFVGHGQIYKNDPNYYLIINNSYPKRGSGLKLDSLAESLQRDSNRHLRQYIIIDACMSGQANKTDWHSTKGVALLCSTDKDRKSDAAGSENCTQFTDALLRVLEQPDVNSAHEAADPRMSLREIKRRMAAILKDRWKHNAILPQVHSPEQNESGDIGDEPLFPRPVVAVVADKIDAAALPSVWDNEQRRMKQENRKWHRKEKIEATFNGIVVFLVLLVGFLLLRHYVPPSLYDWPPSLYRPAQYDNGSFYSDRRIHVLTGDVEVLKDGKWIPVWQWNFEHEKEMEKFRPKPGLDSLLVPKKPAADGIKQLLGLDSLLIPKKPATEGIKPFYLDGLGVYKPIRSDVFVLIEINKYYRSIPKEKDPVKRSAMCKELQLEILRLTDPTTKNKEQERYKAFCESLERPTKSPP